MPAAMGAPTAEIPARVRANFFAKVDPDDAYYRYLHTGGGAWSIGGFIMRGSSRPSFARPA